MKFNNVSGIARIGTQVFSYGMCDMFDTLPASEKQEGLTPDMVKRFNEIRSLYQKAGYRTSDHKTTRHNVNVGGRRFTQEMRTFSVFDVPLKCLKGKKAKELHVYLWINL